MSDQPLRVVVVGAGNMGRKWIAIAEESPAFDLVGVVDIFTDGARAAADGVGRTDVPVAASLEEILEQVETDAVANVTIPAAHFDVTRAALARGLHVVSEKPAAATLAESLALAAASEVHDRLFVVSQSRRHNSQLHELKKQISAFGRVGIATTEFFKAPHFGGFRDEMEHPLLVDMAIHPFDSARFVLDADPVAVYCEEYNPAWSWYRGDAAATAIFEMTGGVRYIYTGSWASPGVETSWNGSWRVSGEGGSAIWNGDDRPQSEPAVAGESEALRYGGVSESLHSFVGAVHTGSSCSGAVHENILSLAMVEAAVISAQRGQRVRIDDVLEDARADAIAATVERGDEAVRAALDAWGNAGTHLRSRAARSAALDPAGA
ncbi:Gfo/Idh/MocA family protein [Microbacterium sp.]|uniref:Gfo/Idh/MocA family protein n=1 Tax=Microbacterium sp. TaxID=51671 RepID=UPI002736A40A|nr:Gfo/Idh/MocA family oxidoreductase [Microbacterium sp.]MDP3952814.1 Gfo/Idh/MocA family oxidoreductase [Microbacterium sp.]